MLDTQPRECSIADTLELIGDRWSILAVREMFLGVRRFNDIVRNTGAPRDVLSARLRKLEEVGVLRRELYSERPERYEYRLTEAGRALQAVLLTLKEWGDTWLSSGRAPMRFSHSCGAELHSVVTCAACGSAIADRTVRLAP